MSTAKSPGAAVTAHGAFEIDQLGGTVFSKNSPHRNFTQAPSFVERDVVAYLQPRGFAEPIPLSGSVGGPFIGDITIPTHGSDLCVGVRVRGRGLPYNWLNGRNVLTKKRDREAFVVRFSFAADIAAATSKNEAQRQCTKFLPYGKNTRAVRCVSDQPSSMKGKKMTNDKNGNGNVPANLSNAAAHLLKATARSNPLMRYKKSKFFIGDDEIPLGREYFAFPREWTRGLVRWEDGQVVEERLGKVADGFQIPDRNELGHTDESAWENGKDPWALQNLLPLEDRETGEFIIFVSSSFGGKLAIEKLVNRYAREIGAGRDLGNPIIRLGTYDRPNKEYGPIPTPQFEIVGWENPEAPLPPIKDALGGEEIPF